MDVHPPYGKPNTSNTKPTIWRWFIEPMYGDFGDGLWHWVYYISPFVIDPSLHAHVLTSKARHPWWLMIMVSNIFGFVV